MQLVLIEFVCFFLRRPKQNKKYQSKQFNFLRDANLQLLKLHIINLTILIKLKLIKLKNLNYNNFCTIACIVINVIIFNGKEMNLR